MHKLVKTIPALSLASLTALTMACSTSGINTESHKNLDFNKNLTAVNPSVNQSGTGL